MGPEDSIRLSRLGKRFYPLFSIHSKFHLLDRENKKVRLYLRNIDKIDWRNMSGNRMPVLFFEYYYEKLDKLVLSGNRWITIEFIEKHVEDLLWYTLSSNPALTEEFIRKHIRYLDHRRLSDNPSLTDQICKEYPKIIHWDILSRNYNISDEFLLDNIQHLTFYRESLDPCRVLKYINSLDPDEIPWEVISKSECLPLEFFENNLSNLNREILSFNLSLPTEFFDRHTDLIDLDILISNPSVEFWFLWKNRDMIEVFWERLSNWSIIPVHIIEENLEDAIGNIEMNTLPWEFWEKHASQIDWWYLGHNTSIPLHFWEKHVTLIEWGSLSSNPSIPMDFFIEHEDKIVWRPFSEIDKK